MVAPGSPRGAPETSLAEPARPPKRSGPDAASAGAEDSEGG